MTTIPVVPSIDISDTPVVRTLLYNLVMISSAITKQEYYTEVANQVASEIPGRIFVLLPDTDKTLPSSNLFCNIATDGKRTFCGEVITLNMDADPSVLPGKVFPLIVPDLPVYIWKDESISDDADLDWVDIITDINIVDACRSKSNLVSSIPTIDMTWLRLDSWMKAIIRAFDSIDAMDDLEEILISTDQNAIENLIASPILLTAWIADCLDPETKLIGSSQNTQLLLSFNDKQIPLNTEHNASLDFCSSVKSVSFRFSGQRGMREIIVEQESDRLCIKTEPEDFLQTLLPEPVISDGALLAREISDEAMQHRYSALARLAVHIGLI